MNQKFLTEILLKAFFIMCCCLLVGVVIIVLTLYFLPKNYVYNFDSTTIPHHYLDVFYHNLLIYLVFWLPLIGLAYYVYSFFMVYVYIGLAIFSLGVGVVILKLFHLPFELYAFTLPVVLQRKITLKQKKEIGLLFLVGVVLLFIASVIEMTLQ